MFRKNCIFSLQTSTHPYPYISLQVRDLGSSQHNANESLLPRINPWSLLRPISVQKKQFFPDHPVDPHIVIAIHLWEYRTIAIECLIIILIMISSKYLPKNNWNYDNDDTDMKRKKNNKNPRLVSNPGWMVSVAQTLTSVTKVITTIILRCRGGVLRKTPHPNFC